MDLRDDSTPLTADFAATTSDGDYSQTVTKSGYIIYARRWYMLFIFSWFSFMQCVVWSTWGPIADDAKEVYGWTDGTIALLANWGPIMYIPTSFLFSWIMDNKGLRPAVVISVILTFAGAAIRCLTAENPTATVLIHIGHILNASAGPAAMAGSVKLSQEWFPAHERTTSTGVASQSNLLGFALSFSLGPQLVKSANSQDILNFLYVQAAFCIPPFLAILLYFPSSPPTPPSVSADKETNVKSDYIADLKALLANNQFLLLVASYGLSAGFYNGWGSVLDVNLSDHGFSQDLAGWIGFGGTVAGGFGGVLLGIFADRVRHMKLLLITLFFLAATTFFYFALGCVDSVPSSSAILIIVTCLGGFFLNSTIPLFYEYAIEVSYPIGEGTAGSMLTNGNNLGCMIFLFLPVDVIGTSWMNWALAGICGFFGLALFLLKEENKRYTMDVNRKNFPVEGVPSPQSYPSDSSTPYSIAT